MSKQRILLVEDSRFFNRVLQSNIKQALDFEVVSAYSYEDAVKIIENDKDFFLALLDLNLPDAPDGEIVDFVRARNIPIIVFTGQFSPEKRQEFISKNIIDYVVKDTPASIDYVVELVGRIDRNMRTWALVVDSIASDREALMFHMQRNKFQVLEAADGEEAMKLLSLNPNIKLVLTDYNLIGMDGFELTKNIRRNFPREELVIIGMSNDVDGTVPARFIKYGANDYVHKPILPEEVSCRIFQGLQVVEYIDELRTAATTDFLTGLYNRRYFFDRGGKMFDTAIRNKSPLALAMIDIDHFKKINDNFGHDAGDEVLVQVSHRLKAQFSSAEILARMGGEEFCLIMPGLDAVKAEQALNTLRLAIENTNFEFASQKINATISIGLCVDTAASLSQMISDADDKLYEAKTGGRNKVVAHTLSQAV